jgi:hypothetical protein
MKRVIRIGLFLLAAVGAANERADVLPFRPQIGLDAGVKPVLAPGTTQLGDREVEVHRTSFGGRRYSSGRAAGTGMPAVGQAQYCDAGAAPLLTGSDLVCCRLRWRGRQQSPRAPAAPSTPLSPFDRANRRALR